MKTVWVVRKQQNLHEWFTKQSKEYDKMLASLANTSFCLVFVRNICILFLTNKLLHLLMEWLCLAGFFRESWAVTFQGFPNAWHELLVLCVVETSNLFLSFFYRPRGKIIPDRDEGKAIVWSL